MSKPTFIKELFDRRVPQISGLYIAATWMMIEIGDWTTARFNMPESITSYIFIGMLFFLPSVIILAYQYGKPGKDRWRKTTFIFLPSNLIVACVAMFYLVSPVKATEIKQVIDENGITKSFEVSKKEYRTQVLGFFWRNKSGDPELGWMQYGLAWLLNRDLDRSLFISSYTPFSSGTTLSGLKKAGFDRALNVPKSLQLELARKRFIKYSLDGQFDFKNNLYTLEVDVYEAASGRLQASHLATGKNLLSLIDDLTINIKKSINIPLNINEQSTDLPLKEHTSESIIAIENLINSEIKRQLDNDYSASKELLQKSIKKDFSFTNAYLQLALTNQLMGNIQEASIAIALALKHEYKLTTEEEFLYRGMVYGFRGDYKSQVKIYDMWIELFPEDVNAHKAMARLLLITGLDHNKAINSLKQLRSLTPDDDSIIRSMTTLFVLQGELEKAIETQQQYTQLNPQDNNGLIELATIYERTAQFDLAKETYHRVLLLEIDNYTASIRLALLDVKLGDFESAENQLAILLANANSERQIFDVLQGYSSFYTSTGQIEKAILTIDKMKQHSQHLPPILKIFNLDFVSSLYLANLGRFKQALESLERVKKQLQPPIDAVVEVGVVSIQVLAKNQQKAQESIIKLEEYIKLYPNPMFSSVIDSANARLSELKNDFETAVKLHQRSIDAMSGNVVNTQSELSILNNKVFLANAKREIGLIADAKQELLEVIRLYPSMPQAHYRLAQCYLAENNLVGFNTAIQRAEASWINADREYIEYKKMFDFKQQVENTIID